MDWSNDTGFDHLDLGEPSYGTDAKMGDALTPNSTQMYSVDSGLGAMSSGVGSVSAGSTAGGSSSHSTGLRTPSVHGSEPDLTALGLSGDASEAVDPSTDMDMSEWLDVIMPTSIALAQLPPPPANSFPTSSAGHYSQACTVDPILTPRVSHDVFDIFNMDEPDFGQSAMSWDKVVE